MERYYHMYANGDDAKNFVIEENDFKAAFNRIAVCASMSGIRILAASIEDSHPHVLLKGLPERAEDFKRRYKDLSTRYITRHRGSFDGVVLNLELSEIHDESYLMNAAIYVIIQATKDGKPVLPYDYLYGTGALYFRRPGTILPWDHDYKGALHERRGLGSFPIQEQWRICNTKVHMPSEWIVVNGIIHPGCYIDIAGYEAIFRTHNCFRAFLASNKSRDEIVRRTMASVRGITMEDMEARRLCQDRCVALFGKRTTMHLTTEQRLTLAQNLRSSYRLSFRQLSKLTRLPESEIRKYTR